MRGRRGRVPARRTWAWFLVLGLLSVGPAPASRAVAQSDDDVTALRRELAAKQAEVERQREELARQQEELQRQREELERQAAELAALAARLDRAVGREGAGEADTEAAEAQGEGTGAAARGEVARGEAAQAPDAAAAATAPEPVLPDQRDAVGDLNAEAVAAGDFPGSILIPGTRKVSLAIGGFLKTVATEDSDLEGTGPIFLPANIGASRPDTEGATSFDASLSRVHLDARAPTPEGGVRGYIEVDLNSANNGSLGVQIRHAYGAWNRGRGTLTAGHTWSTAMDLGVLPEGLTEPTLSGAIFQRQAQLRWSQGITDHFKLDFALEDATSSDATIGGPWRPSTRLPDLVAATAWDWGRAGHVRVTGLLRELRVTDEAGRSAAATGWGVSLGSHVGVGTSDKLAFGLSVGEGSGRYLLGLPGGSAGFADVTDGDLDLLSGAGAFATYRHPWTARLRSTAAYGRAWVDDTSWQAADAFDSSTFGLVNLLWSPLDYVTFGAEYQYGERQTKDGASRENHRVIFGVQIF